MNFPEWSDLFGDGPARREFRIVRKHGEPLLLLPADPAVAAQTLQLYPAQTFVARTARRVLTLAARCGMPLPLARTALAVSEDPPFAGFLRSVGGGALPPFGVFLGNSRAPGRRWIFLLFDGLRPIAVVKAGVSPRARELIAAEIRALAQIPADLPGRPRVLGEMFENSVAAIACGFVAGRSPRAEGADEQLRAFFSSWLQSGPPVELATVSAWQRLAAFCGADARFQRLAAALAGLCVTATPMHGDFAPWNLREEHGRWTVLDWERGESLGVPGWDWFHFVIQSAALVRRQRGPVLRDTAENLLRSPALHAFAERAGINAHLRELLAAYVLYVLEVLRPTEGAEALRELLPALFDG